MGKFLKVPILAVLAMFVAFGAIDFAEAIDKDKAEVRRVSRRTSRRQNRRHDRREDRKDEKKAADANVPVTTAPATPEAGAVPAGQ